MTEDEARAAAAVIAGDAMLKLEQYAGLLAGENERQNLIARSTIPLLWQRHLLDSLQLARFARDDDHTLLDVGSGPGLPGLVLAIVGRWHVTLVEPRRRRAEFLAHAVATLGLRHVEIRVSPVETVEASHDLITARAVASVGDLLGMTRNATGEHTRFILPKGKSATTDVDLACQQWHGVFHVEQSLTDPGAGIVIADRVSRR